MIQIDMPIPEKCGLCPCFHHENPMYCQAVKADKNKKIVNPYGLPRPEWCPLKEQEAVEPEVEVLNEIDRLYRCPRCHKCFVYKKQKYCDQCGQEVKWE